MDDVAVVAKKPLNQQETQSLQVPDDLKAVVALALQEDLGSGDLHAHLFSATENKSQGQILVREQAVLCGIPWVNEVYRQLGPAVQLYWLVAEGEAVTPNQTVLQVFGPSHLLLAGERCALNFLQTLSGTATISRRYAELVADSSVKLLDTRKTVPGLRTAQKYAVRCGGCYNHRMGLYDFILIKENHILASGSLAAAVNKARQKVANELIAVEVETLTELEQALALKVQRILLDNFTLPNLYVAVAKAKGRAKLEVSGGVNLKNVVEISKTGVDYISIGGLTKHLTAVDMSFRLRDEKN